MKKKQIALLAVVAFAVIGLSACQGTSNQVDEKVKQEILDNEAAAEEAEAEIQQLEQSAEELDQVDSLLEGI